MESCPRRSIGKALRGGRTYPERVSETADVRWFLVFNGIADRWLGPFEADGWQLIYRDPACGMLGILPADGGNAATIDDARWLADVAAFDHDAPIGISPAVQGVFPDAVPGDPAAAPPLQPIQPFEGPWTMSYWQWANAAYAAAAELRFNGSYVIRYDNETGAPDTCFATRFAGREELVGLYAMAARQAYLLAEYLCLYRVLEAADNGNGKEHVANELPSLRTTDFGELRVVGDDLSYETAPNAFEVFRDRAENELKRLAANGVDDVPAYLYSIRNSLAHGKRDLLTARHAARFADAARALPIVKLLARRAVES
jgi:hypothetical protein